MSIVKTTAILIKSRKYKEKDKLLTFYTEEAGKLVARCKGARDPFNHWGHNSEPPNICWLQLYELNGFYLVTEMKPIFNLFGIVKEYERMLAFESFVHLLDHALEMNIPSRSFFGLCLSFLNRLNQASENPRWLAYQFLFDYMKWQGFSIHLDHCVLCRAPVTKHGEMFSLYHREGGLVCPSCAKAKSFFNPISFEMIVALQEFFTRSCSEETKGNKVFFQNWEDLDRIVKEYYQVLFGKELQTYLSLKKM